MTTVLLTIGILGIAMLGIGIGLLFGRSEIKGSCGGVGGGACSVCGNDASKCETGDHPSRKEPAGIS
ncbi:MAG: hypothetical protein CMF59_11675 [Leptospiraceae bacterium]|nr:hypothetical protein [Leptospiraceae bacterium]